jgi:hypothetical protein
MATEFAINSSYRRFLRNYAKLIKKKCEIA